MPRSDLDGELVLEVLWPKGSPWEMPRTSTLWLKGSFGEMPRKDVSNNVGYSFVADGLLLEMPRTKW